MKGILCLISASACFAQNLSQRGFLETGVLAYPQDAIGDSGRVVGRAVLSYEATYRLSPALSFNGGVEARADTHHEVQRNFGLSWWDRERARPAFAVRRFSAVYAKGLLTVELGKQFIRWGKADILNPTDRFAPRDYINVVNNDFLAVTAGRLTLGGQSNTLDLVWTPRLTSSRTPLLGQRWVIVPPPVSLPVRDGGAIFPGGPQFGARWNHISQAAEVSLSFFEGFNHLPLIDPLLQSRRPQSYLNLRSRYPKIRMFGADTVIPLSLFTVKAEAAWFTSPAKEADDYTLYVVQLERQTGEWHLVGGYAGEYVTEKRSPFDFAPDRGLTRAFLGRAGYTIDARRSVSLETAVRQNGKGVWVRLEYTQAFGEHWRATTGFTWIRGEAGDFLGQFHRNSHASLAIRYSF